MPQRVPGSVLDEHHSERPANTITQGQFKFCGSNKLVRHHRTPSTRRESTTRASFSAPATTGLAGRCQPSRPATATNATAGGQPTAAPSIAHSAVGTGQSKKKITTRARTHAPMRRTRSLLLGIGRRVGMQIYIRRVKGGRQHIGPAPWPGGWVDCLTCIFRIII